MSGGKKKVKEKRDEVSLELRVVTLGVDWDVEVVTDSGCSFCKEQRKRIVRLRTLLINQLAYHNNMNVKLFLYIKLWIFHKNKNKNIMMHRFQQCYE